MKYLVLLLTATLFMSCDRNTEPVMSYFGGQIINPKGELVYLYKGDQLIDSAGLNDNNKFLIPLDSLSLGLYVFKHWDEVQYIYLEPGDSLLIRLNTWDFDESLVFSGKGAEQNNFLINLFLVSEKEDKLFFDYYHLNDSLFDLKVDSLLRQKELLYSQFREEIPENSAFFEKLAHAAIYYPLYRNKEAYPYRHSRAIGTYEYTHTDPIFYKFRKDIDINDPDLVSFYAHRDYVRTYLFHLAYEKQLIDSFKNPMEVNFMKVALEKIQIDEVKNKFLHEGIWMTLLDENANEQQKEDAQRLFFDHCSDQESVAEISRLISAAEMSPKGHRLPSVELINTENKAAKLDEIIQGKNVVLYTWPTSLREVDNLAKRLKYLEKYYPKLLFVGINSKNTEYKWKKYISAKKINPDHQYRTTDKNVWLDVTFSRAILVDNNGIVQNNMTHLSSGRFENQLKKLNKR